MDILYVDESIDKSVVRTLSKYGRVLTASDVNEAFRLLVENRFEYYFIGADLPNALPFIRHVKRDPSLIPPKGYILLTNNKEEDCEAWGVDAYIHRSRFKSDISYVFSHPRGSDGATAKVCSISDGFDPYGERDGKGEDLISIAPRGKDLSGQRKTIDVNKGRRGLIFPGHGPARLKKTAAILTFSLIIIALLGVSVIIFGGEKPSKVKGEPPRKTAPAGAAEEHEERSGDESSDKESEVTGESSNMLESLEGAVAGEEPGDQGYSEEDLGEALPSEGTPVDGHVESPVSNGEDAPSPEETPGSNPPVDPQDGTAPAPPNRDPTVSISGPTEVPRGHTAYFQAIASDSDGDSLTYSWSGAAGSGASAGKNFPSPGQFGVSVTVSDGRGGTATASMTVNVI